MLINSQIATCQTKTTKPSIHWLAGLPAWSKWYIGQFQRVLGTCQMVRLQELEVSSVICPKSCRLQFQFTTVCFWLMHLCHESSLQSLSLFIQHSPLYSFFFFSVFTHRNVNLRTHCRGEERDFPSLIHLFPSLLPLLNHFRLLLSLSVFLCSLLFTPYALPSTFLQALFLFKLLLVVYWSVIAVSLEL